MREFGFSCAVAVLWSGARWVGAGLVGVGLVGVGLVGGAAGCRLDADPACDELAAAGCGCPAWTERGADGACVARRWTEATTLGAGDGARLAMGRDGRAAVTWIEIGDGTTPRVAIETSTGWSASSPADSGHGTDPIVATTRAGDAVALWREGSSVRVGFAEGGRWRWPSAPLSLGLEVANPHVAVSGDDFIGVWNQWTGANWGVGRALLSGGEVSDRSSSLFDLLSPTINFSNDPIVAANEEGEAIITWYQATNDKLMTFVSEKAATSRFFTRPGADDVVSPFGYDVDHPHVAMDARGNVAVVWAQRTSASLEAVFLASRQNGVWTRPVDTSDGFSESVASVRNVRATFAPSGDLYVVWHQDADGDKAVFVAHRAADESWVASGRAPLRLSAPGVRGFDPTLAASERGVVAAWAEQAEGGRGYVVARRSAVDAAGQDEASRWGSPAVLSSPNTLAGGAYVAMGGTNDRAACVWLEDGQVRIATIE